MFLRVRTPTGMIRLDVPAGSMSAKGIRDIIVSSGRIGKDDEFDICHNGKPIDDGRSLTKSLGLMDGDVLAVVLRSKSEAPSTEMKSDEPAGETEWKARCLHGPNMVCAQCSKSEKAKSAATGQYSSLVNALMRVDLTWLCNHPDNAVCVNCMNTSKGRETLTRQRESLAREEAVEITKTASAAGLHITEKCHHPPSMFCQFCSPETKELEGNRTEQRRRDELRKHRCNCPPGHFCIHCLPEEEEANPYIVDLNPQKSCPNHGPHGSCIACLARLEGQKIKVKQQVNPHVARVSFDLNAANQFQLYLQLTRFRVHRCGILYGRIARKNQLAGSFDDSTAKDDYSDDCEVLVDAIYEPHQRYESGEIFLEDKMEETLDKVSTLAGLMGMEIVGYIFSHEPRAHIMSAHDLIQSAKLASMSRHPKRFVIATLHQAGADMDDTEIEAFQLSDQYRSMFLAGCVAPVQPQANLTRTTRSCIVEGSDCVDVDPNFFLVTVGISQFDGLVGTGFAIENRDTPQTDAELKEYFSTRGRKSLTESLNDFHLLLYFVNTQRFDLQGDIPALTDAIVAKKKISEGFRYMLGAILDLDFTDS